ncbi:MAG: 3-oxoacyl-ACP reductase family protein [Gammaproteobacteria bacterium]
MTSSHRVALVTGGSRGIGRAIALALAADGCDVALSYVSDTDGAADTARAIEASGRRALALCADLGAPDAASALVDAVLDAWGHIDVLVNNAGVSSNDTLIADTSPSAWARIIDVNLNGTYHMVHAVVPHMRGRGGGHIVNLSSNVTQRMPPTFGAYTVSKAGIEALTRILAKEEGPHGIHVNAIAPGPIATDMLNGLLERMGAARAQAFVDSVPLRRIGRPEEIAAMVAMLVSSTASFVSGEVIYVNGGGPGG